MLNLKKTAVAVLAFGSSAVFAGTMGPVCTANPVTVPCERTAWDFGVQALYLKPSFSNSVGSFNAVSTPTSLTYRENDADWNWGFKLEGSYHFSTGNDLNLNWYHIGDDSKTNRSLVSVVGNTGAFTAVDAFTLKPSWDAVNLGFGQHVDFGEFKKIRFHGGVQYSRIKTEARHSGLAAVTTTGLPTVATSVPYNVSSTSKYNGFGPRIGADYSYELGNGLAVYAKGATTILAGTSKLTSSAPALAALGLQTTINTSRTVLVPEVEAKLGVTYNWALAQGDLALDVGYMWVNYFNAQQASAYTDSSFGLNGPFAGLKWVGTVV